MWRNALAFGVLTLAVAALVFLLTGCASIAGPCRMTVQDGAGAFECQEGGRGVIVAPARALEAFERDDVGQRPRMPWFHD